MPAKPGGLRVADDPVPPPREAGDTSDELVEAARAGDQAAFGRLVEMHQRPLTRLTHRLLGDRDDADGAVQDTFIKAWTNIRTFRGECRFGTWLARIAVNQCRDRLQRKRLVVTERQLGPESRDGKGASVLERAVDPSPDPEERAVGAEIARKIAEQIGGLPDMQREVFALRYYEDRPLAEIAALFGVNVGTVKTHLFRATQRIRRALEAFYGPRLPVS
jgi:RNA polymerase sigma-70 factor, ECF subfamily